MITVLKLAWRNIWRNRRRTTITIASIMFALFFAIIMRAFQIGSYVKMKENAVESYSGYFQIHKKGYWDDKNINKVFKMPEDSIKKLAENPKIKVVIPRLESFSLASSGTISKGVAVMGIDPEKEDEMTKIKSYLTQGSFINSADNSVLVAEDLAKFLNVKVNDTLVLYSSGYHGSTAAGLFPIKGILKLPVPEMNRSTLYMPIAAAQTFFSTGNQVTGLIFDLYAIDDAPIVEQTISKQLNLNTYEIIDWQIMNKDLLQMIASDDAGGIIMIAILYLVIAFGVFGTVLMMTTERIREFSVMIAIGMQKAKLIWVVIWELILITFLAVIAGAILSLPVLIYFYYNPIQFTGELVQAMKNFNFEPVMPVAINIQLFVNQAIVIFVISMLAMLYPVLKIKMLKVVQGLKS
jgi:ABC-type lipoprotein release transport system permease subunit